MNLFVAWACTLASSSIPLGGICYTDPATYQHARTVEGCVQTIQDMVLETNGYRPWVEYKCVEMELKATVATGNTRNIR